MVRAAAGASGQRLAQHLRPPKALKLRWIAPGPLLRRRPSPHRSKVGGFQPPARACAHARWQRRTVVWAPLLLPRRSCASTAAGATPCRRCARHELAARLVGARIVLLQRYVGVELVHLRRVHVTSRVPAPIRGVCVPLPTHGARSACAAGAAASGGRAALVGRGPAAARDQGRRGAPRAALTQQQQGARPSPPRPSADPPARACGRRAPARACHLCVPPAQTP